MSGEPHCKNCGHSARYHGHPKCGYNSGDHQICECATWEDSEVPVLLARIEDLTRERDAYMQTVLDTIHWLAESRPDVPQGAVGE